MTAHSREHHSRTQNGSELIVLGKAEKDGKCLFADELAKAFTSDLENATGNDEISYFKAVVSRLNGSWSIVLRQSNNRIFAAVDRLRSVPLFYTFSVSGSPVVSDRIQECIANKANVSLAEDSIWELLAAGYVIGNRTLISGVYQILGGESVVLTPGLPIESHRYFRFLPSNICDSSEKELQDRFEGILHTTFDRVVKFLDGRTAIVPLSAGIDSRYVAALLKIHGHKNTIAISYGTKENRESEISRRISETLGYPWEFAQLDAAQWRNVFKSDSMNEMLRDASQWTSSPCFQDLPAFAKLVDENKLPPNSVVLAGITAGVHAASYTTEFGSSAGVLDREAVVQSLMRRRFSFWPVRQDIRTRIESDIGDFLTGIEFAEFHSSAHALDLWEFENREAKFIINSVRAYEHWDFDWINPMCDNEILDFLLTLPIRLKKSRLFYTRFLRDRICCGELSLLAEIPVRGQASKVWSGRKDSSIQRFRSKFRTTRAANLLRTIRNASVSQTSLQRAMDQSQVGFIPEDIAPEAATISDFKDAFLSDSLPDSVLGALADSGSELILSQKSNTLHHLRVLQACVRDCLKQPTV